MLGVFTIKLKSIILKPIQFEIIKTKVRRFCYL